MTAISDLHISLPPFVIDQSKRLVELKDKLRAAKANNVLNAFDTVLLEASTPDEMISKCRTHTDTMKPVEESFFERHRKIIKAVHGSKPFHNWARQVEDKKKRGLDKTTRIPKLSNLLVEIEDDDVFEQTIDCFVTSFLQNDPTQTGALEHLLFQSGLFVVADADRVGAALRRRLSRGSTKEIAVIHLIAQHLTRIPEEDAGFILSAAKSLGAKKSFHSVVAICENFLKHAQPGNENTMAVMDVLWFAYLRVGRESDAELIVEKKLLREPHQKQPLVDRAVLRALGDSAALATELEASAAHLGQSTIKGNVLYANSCNDIGAPARGEGAIRLAIAEQLLTQDRPSTDYILTLSNLQRGRPSQVNYIEAAMREMQVHCTLDEPTMDGMRFDLDLYRTQMERRPSTRVAIVMTAYNAGEFIAHSITSILQQTYSNFELWVVDDGSSDNTQEICQEIAARDERLKYIRNRSNSGTYISKNYAIAASDTPLVALCDSDDIWVPDHLERHVNFMEENLDCVCSTSDWLRMDDRGCFEVGMRGSYVEVCPHSTVFRRGVFSEVGLFDSVRFGADREFLTRVEYAFGARAIKKLNAVLTIGRRHGASLTSSGVGKLDQVNRSDMRMQYWKTWNEWQLSELTSDKQVYNSGDPLDRPYAVPGEMLGAPFVASQ